MPQIEHKKETELILSKFLVINLIRYRNDGEKINSEFQYPAIFTYETNKYKLISIIEHFGTTL